MATLLDPEAPSRESLERSEIRVEDDPRHWSISAPRAADGARFRRAFRTYLERHGHPASDFGAAEAVYGELVNTCVSHAPGGILIEFTWEDATLVVNDETDRLRSWPFCPEDQRSETTYHAYAIVSALTRRIRLSRNPSGGTRASVALPVMRA